MWRRLASMKASKAWLGRPWVKLDRRADRQRDDGGAFELADGLLRGLHRLTPGGARVLAEQLGPGFQVGFEEGGDEGVGQAGQQLVAGVLAGHVQLAHDGGDILFTLINAHACIHNHM